MTRYSKQCVIEIGDYVLVNKEKRSFVYGESDEMKEARLKQIQGKVLYKCESFTTISFDGDDNWYYDISELILARKGEKK